MMDTEDLRSELLALQRLYRLLVKEEHFVQVTDSQNLDKNAKRLLKRLLDDVAEKAFEAHEKMLGTQYKTSYSPWSMQQEQPRDGQNLLPFSLRNAPPSNRDSNMQNFDLLTGPGTFNEPTEQLVSFGQSTSISPGESSFRLKRCRICQKPKVKQLIREASIRDSESFTPRRTWEVGNESSGIGGFAYSSNNPFADDVFESLSLTNLIGEEEQISREASAKIQKIESCILGLQVVATRVDFIENLSENEPSQMENFAAGRSDLNSSRTDQETWKFTDTAPLFYDQTARSYNDLALQTQPSVAMPVSMMLPSGKTMSQPAEQVNQRNQHHYRPEEIYTPFHHTGDSSKIPVEQVSLIDQYHHMPEESYTPFHGTGVSSNFNLTDSSYRPSHGSFSSPTKGDPLDHMQMTQLWIPPVGSIIHGGHDNERKESEFTRPKNHGEMYKDVDQIDHHQGTRVRHDLVEPKRVVSPKSQLHSDSTVSSSNHSSSWTTQSQSQSESQSESQSQSQSQSPSQQASTSFSGSESETELKSGSSRSRDQEGSESEMYSFSSQSESPYMNSSSESSASISRENIPTKGHQGGNHNETKRKSESKMSSVSSRDQSPYVSSSSESLVSMSWKTVPKKGHKWGTQKESKRKSESKMNLWVQSPKMSSSSKSSGSISRKVDPTKGHQKGSQKEPKSKTESKMNLVSTQGQSPKMSSSSESSGSISSKVPAMEGHKKDNQKEPKTKNESKRKLVLRHSPGPKMSSSSESSGSISRKVAATKGHQKGSQKEPKIKTESKMNLVSTRDQSPKMSSSSESSGSISRKGQATEGHKKDNQKEPKTKKVSIMKSVLRHGLGPKMSGPRKSLGLISRKVAAAKKGHQKGSQEEPKSETENKRNMVSTRGQSLKMSSSSESSGSISRKAATKGHKKDNEKELKSKNESKMKLVLFHGQAPKTDISKEPSGSKSKMIVPFKSHVKGDKKEQKGSGVGTLTKLKDKFAIMFQNHHQHHHHHHHHHHHGGDEDKHKKSIWNHAKNAIGHKKKKGEASAEKAVKKKKDEAIGEKAVKKIEKKFDEAIGEKAVKKIEKQLVVHKAEDKKQKAHLKSIVDGFLKPSKKSDKSKDVTKKLPSSGKKVGGNKGNTMQWLKILRNQRKIKRIDKLRGKVKHASKG